MAGGGFHDAHEVVFEIVELGSEELDSSGGARDLRLPTVAQRQDIAGGEAKQKLGVTRRFSVCSGRRNIVEIRIASKSALVNKGVVVEMNVAACRGRESMTICG